MADISQIVHVSEVSDLVVFILQPAVVGETFDPMRVPEKELRGVDLELILDLDSALHFADPTDLDSRHPVGVWVE